MSRWEMVRLGDVCEIVSGTTPKTNTSEFWNGDIKWITPAELTSDSYFIYDTERKITEKAGLKPMPIGTVILSSRAPIGKVAIAGVSMCCNQGFKNLICSEKILNRYLYRWLKSQTVYLNNLGRGSTFKEISKSIVEEIKIPLPPIKLQEKIADTFDRASAIIEKRKFQIEKLDLLVKSRFVEMFGTLESPNNGVEIKRLDDVCERITDGTHQTPVYSSSGYVFLSSKDVKRGVIDWSDIRFIPEELHNELSKRVSPKRNDLLLAKNGTTGTAALVDTDDIFDIYVSLALLRPKSSVVPVYLLMAINNNMTKHQFNTGLRGIGVPNLHLNVIKEVKILVAPSEAQHRFADFVRAAVKSKFEMQQGLKKLELIYNALMQQYFGQQN